MGESSDCCHEERHLRIRRLKIVELRTCSLETSGREDGIFSAGFAKLHSFFISGGAGWLVLNISGLGSKIQLLQPNLQSNLL